MRWLVVVVIALAGCISIPEFEGEFLPRVVARGYRKGGDDPAPGTAGLTKEGYSIGHDPIADGELVLFVGSIDNGSGLSSFWGVPDGFTVVATQKFGLDTQTYFVASKIADHEPAEYTGAYTRPIDTGGATTIAIVAIGGVDRAHPIDMAVARDSTVDTSPVTAPSPGVTAAGPGRMIIYCGGPDWHFEAGTNTFTPPDMFTTLTAFGDQDDHWDWTSEAIAYHAQAAAGDTGPLTGTFTGLRDDTSMFQDAPGAFWDVVLAIAPAN